jgi:uncharacterized protein
MKAGIPTLAAAAAAVLFLAAPAQAAKPPPPPPDLPSDIPKRLETSTDSFDYVKREEMIPMRDGVKLKTFILIPKGAHDAPMLMTRTPYHAAERVMNFNSPHLAAAVPQFDDTAVAAGYIIVYQDVRGKYGSYGSYVMNRPLRGPLNASATDHATDTYDSIEWLVHHVPESNGRVGISGGSYEGFTAVVATVHPHPALKVSVPFAPMIDGWMGDDWFHNGAFRQDDSLAYFYDQEGSIGSEEHWWTGSRDTYDEFLRAGSAGALAAAHGLEQVGFWREILAHPAYDSFWQQQALDKLLAQQPVTVPMMIVSGLFDQEDSYGGPALFAALAPKDPQGQYIHLVLGPWNHGGGRHEGRRIGPIEFEGDTATWFRRNIMQPFLDHYLKDAPDPEVPRVLAYETGANLWHRYDSWPRACAQGCPQAARNLYLLPGGRLGFEAPAAAGSAAAGSDYDQYISDPAKPVPYRLRPTLASFAKGSTWGEWLVDDQRNAAARTDVLVYETEPLKTPLRIAGQPYADLFASTSGSDSDWVVKLIDVYPSEVPEKPELGGYQLMIAADIFRGRYREDLAVAHPLVSDEALPYHIRLPNADHTFLPGHRLMVQVQSSWFPLYDRNPQSFVANISLAVPTDYRKATQRIWHTAAYPSSILLPVITP